MKTFEEFKASLLKLNENRSHTITGSLGVYDAYKWIRKNKWLDLDRPITELEFYSIIRSINKEIAIGLSNGEEFKIPNKLGTIELRKHTPFIGYKNNKLKVSLAIDWDATLRLWYEDLDAFENQTLIKIPEKEIFKFLYNKNSAHFTNLSFYELAVNREIKRNLKLKIKEGKIDAFLSNKYG